MSGKKLVDTRRLEKLVSKADASDPRAPQSRAPAVTGQRALALSGHRDMRRAGTGAGRSVQRDAAIAAHWDALARCVPDPAPDKAMRQFNAQVRKSDVMARFDLLRAQLSQQFRDRKLVSLGIAGPSGADGASFAVAGLLAAFARRMEQRVIGLDLDQHNASLHRFFEVKADHGISDLISGAVPPEAYLQRLTTTVALGLGRAADAGSAAGFRSQDIATCLTELSHAYAPDMIICDLPPLLQGDACLEICDHLDAVLVVANGRRTAAEDVLACERLLTGRTAFLGVILNHYTGREQL